MPVFDAVCASFSTAGTGGFGIKNDSFMSYSPYIQWVVAIFMMLFGINFGAYFLLTIKRFKEAFRYEEARCYLIIIFAATVIIALGLMPDGMGIEPTVRYAFFQVSSIITTTGFVTADFNLWPQAAKVILVLLMFIGACAGSTGGGIKVSRIMIVWKQMKKEIYGFVHPRAVRKLKLEGHTVESDVISSVMIFVAIYFMIFGASMLLISLDNHDFATNFTAVAATFNNIGPGLSKVGPTCNFGFFSVFSKIILMFDMLAGRLEILPMLVLFNPRTWKK